LTEFTIDKNGLSKQNTKLRVFSSMKPIPGTVQLNDRYVTYFAISQGSKPTMDESSGDLLYDLTMMIFDKQCKTCTSSTKIASKTVNFVELFQAIPNAVPNARITPNYLPGYELSDQFLFLNINDTKSKIMIHTFKLNDDFSFIVHKNNANTGLENISLKLNGSLGGYSDISFSDVFNGGSSNGSMYYWIIG